MGHRSAAVFLSLIILAGCGSGEEASVSLGPAPLSRTLAHVVTECRQQPDGHGVKVGPQVLQVRRGERAPVVVDQIAPFDPVQNLSGTCSVIGATRFGLFDLVIGAYQRLAVTPDGTGVVFEKTDDFSTPRAQPLPPEEKGFFFVRADGSELRRLGPASQEATYRLFTVSGGLPIISVLPGLAVSPNGQMVAYTDSGPGPDGEQTVQIVTLDLRTGARTQVTRLPTTPPEFDPPTCCPRFLDDDTIAFPTVTDPDGSNPQGAFVVVTVHTDGSGLKIVRIPQVSPNSELVPQFLITGTDRSAALFAFVDAGGNPIREIFLFEGDNRLQLTNFQRFDTSDPLLSLDRQQVFFTGAADPFGTNPTRNCQLFSVDVLGAELRQLTQFQQGSTSRGCFFGAPPGCATTIVGQDPDTATLLTYSNCNPLGDNPNGDQIFAQRPDGSGLRQLTDTRGLVASQDGSVFFELPGPFAFSALQR